MTNSKSTKRALLSSAFAVLICVAMLIGTTFAWFTDTASTAVNKIQAGNLDVALEMYDTVQGKWVSAEGETLSFVKAPGAEAEEILWEPGCTYELPKLRVKNNGNLALKYKVLITGIKGDAKLNEAIEWTIGDAACGEEQRLLAGADNEFIIKGHMKEDAGNEYQGLSIDGISITVYATQDTVEHDSKDNTYDEGAEYNTTIVTNSAEAEIALSENKENIYVDLARDVSFDVDESNAKLLGGANTKLIVIDGKGCKLTFNNKNNDTGIVSRAGTKLVIKNAVIDNSGYSKDGGTWSTHDIIFSNYNGEVQLENVTFTNAIALSGKATLTDVKISDKNATQATYMLWIVEGSNVTLNNVTIDGKSAVGKDNRAIAIKNQYVPGKYGNGGDTTLTVNGLTATSDKYAAIYVTSNNETTVNLNGAIDVTGAAVNDNVVQKDAGSTGEIIVNDNSTKVVKAASQDELNNVISSVEAGKSTKVVIGAGKYALPSTGIPAGVAISGEGMGKTNLTAPATKSGAGKTGLIVNKPGVSVSNATITGHADITSDMYSGLLDIREGGTTLDNIEIVNRTSLASGVVINSGVSKGKTVTMKNSKLNVYHRAFFVADGANGTIEIDNCDITGSVYALNVNSGNSQNLVIKCTNSKLHGWSSYGEIKSASFENVEFSKGASNYDYLRPYADTTLKNCTFDNAFKMGAGKAGFTITIEDCAYNGTVLTATNVRDLLFDSDDLSNLKGCTITVNGVSVVL